MKPVEVAVPATSANLGPGFDCLGIALGMHLVVRFSSADEPHITGKARIRSVDDSLIFRSFMAAFAEAGADPPPVRIEVAEDYPSGRGLGASASAIVAGLFGARAAGGLPLATDDLARLAIRIEGHPDNVLAALFGGLVLTVGQTWINLDPSEELAPLVLVARKSFKTQAARKVLPATISAHDAVSNASAVAALVSILSGQSSPANLMPATRDRMHEPYRLPLMPESQKLHKALRDLGLPTVLSGAGPSLLCFVEPGRLEESAETVKGLIQQQWQILRPGWDRGGARVVSV